MEKILVVDDDFSMRKAIALTLRDAGYEILEADNQVQALEIVAANSVHLAILDLFLPDGDGIALADEIRQRQPDVPVILMTAYGEHQRARRAQEIFKENYLEKTHLGQVLHKKVQQILGECTKNGDHRMP